MTRDPERGRREEGEAAAAAGRAAHPILSWPNSAKGQGKLGEEEEEEEEEEGAASSYSYLHTHLYSGRTRGKGRKEFAPQRRTKRR